jgi:hypothetical protein
VAARNIRAPSHVGSDEEVERHRLKASLTTGASGAKT